MMRGLKLGIFSPSFRLKTSMAESQRHAPMIRGLKLFQYLVVHHSLPQVATTRPHGVGTETCHSWLCGNPRRAAAGRGTHHHGPRAAAGPREKGRTDVVAVQGGLLPENRVLDGPRL